MIVSLDRVYPGVLLLDTCLLGPETLVRGRLLEEETEQPVPSCKTLTLALHSPSRPLELRGMPEFHSPQSRPETLNSRTEESVPKIE